jgi:hypothetical protein
LSQRWHGSGFRIGDPAAAFRSAMVVGGRLIDRKFYLFLIGIWISGGLILWTLIRLIDAYVLD